MLHWNTGRQYDRKGQVIFAERQASGEVFFYDASRGIMGVLVLQPWEASRDVKVLVTEHYLNSYNYTGGNAACYEWLHNSQKQINDICQVYLDKVKG